jgi:hypothetical protein
MSLSEKVRQTLKRDGWLGLPSRTIVFSLRRIAWGTDELSKHLDYSTQARTLLRNHASLFERNEIFRDKHKGRRCFVIGNGPSLNGQDLSPLGDELTLVTNAFCRHPILKEWTPTYYFITDPTYFDGSERSRKLLLETRERVPSTTFFVPFYAHEALSKGDLLPAEQTYYVATLGGKEDRWSARPDLTRITPGMQTVVQLAIMAAMFMGCSPIYLLGLDHDWLCHPQDHTNFYQKEEGASKKWQYRPLMEAVLIMWQIYEMLDRIAAAEGISILNATRGGFLDVFERIEYESVVHKL